MDDSLKCHLISETKLLNICKTLSNCLNDYGSKLKGFNLHKYSNIDTFERTRDFVVFRMSSKDKGIILNFCPFCGNKLHREDIGEDAING